MVEVVVCVDGLDPAYLDGVELPGWAGIAERGESGTCWAAVPTLTNVNNVGIVTGVPPDSHGITGNTYYDAARDAVVYMEEPSYVTHPTVFERDAGAAAALFVKEKLEGMAGQGADVTVSAESPPSWLEAAIGAAPDIYSGGASAWILDAAIHILETRRMDVVYVSTTDVIPHKHAPGTDVATEWLEAVDARLARIAALADAVGVTADHGMRRKTTCIDLERVLADAGYAGRVIPLIRDAHTYHHQNLGGAAYVDVDDPAAIDALTTVEGVAGVFRREAAAAEFSLPPDRIGDALVLGTEASVFGPGEGERTRTVALRSHGSTTERTVPYAVTTNGDLTHNYEIFTAVTGPSR